MKFLVVESVDVRVGHYLRALSHDVIIVAQDYPSIADSTVLEIATREGRVLITNDRDFGELIFVHGH